MDPKKTAFITMWDNIKERGTTIVGFLVIIAGVVSVFTGQSSWAGIVPAMLGGAMLIFGSKDGIMQFIKRKL